MNRIFEKLNEIYSDHNNNYIPEWDEESITKKCLENTKYFLKNIPENLAELTEPGIEPYDGCLILEWYNYDNKNMISLSFDNKKRKMIYTYIIYDDNGSGILTFEKSVPNEIIKWIERVVYE